MTDRVDALVIFGATGDLAKLETFPALVGLVDRGVLDVPVIGVAKSGWDLEQFRAYAEASLRLNKIDPTGYRGREDARPARLRRWRPRRRRDLPAVAGKVPAGGRVLFYLEVPPPLFGRIARGIGAAGLAAGARVMVEKPFGTDLHSAQQLNATDARGLPRGCGLPGRPLARPRGDRERPVRTVRQHGPGAAVQPDYVQSIQITMAEAFDVADRGRFYDRAGAVRDVLQNHLLQVLATATAEAPTGTGLSAWREAKDQLVKGLRPMSPAGTVFGQYEGYLDVDGVAPGPHGDVRGDPALPGHWRWADVPILIRAGKCMPVTSTEIQVKFRRPPYNLFGLEPFENVNSLRFRVWPETQDHAHPRRPAARGRDAAAQR